VETTDVAKLTDEEVVALQEQRKAVRAAASMTAIKAILETNKCELRAIPQFTEDGRIVAVVVVVPV